MSSPGEGFTITPTDLDGSGSQLESFGDKMESTSSKMSSTHSKLSAHARSDKSGVGAVITKMADKSEEVMGKVAGEGARVAKAAGQRLKKNGADHAENESRQTSTFKGLHPDAKSTKAHPQNNGEGSSAGAGQPKPPKVKQPKAPKGNQPVKPTGPAGTGPAKPALSEHKPPSAGDEKSSQFEHNPQQPDPKPYSTTTPQADPNMGKAPKDPARGEKVEQLPESRVTRDPETGLITHVDNRPVKDYVGDKSKAHAEALSKDEDGNVPKTGKMTNAERRNQKKAAEGRCSALAIDLKTGSITHGVNGAKDDVIAPQNLHPLLQQNHQDLTAWKHPVQPKEGAEPATLDGRAHYSEPAGHAEVKATNELLWERQAAGEAQHGPDYKLPPSTLNEMRFDPRWTAQTGPEGAIGGAAPACANCNTILHGVPSYTGRCEYTPEDSRYLNPAVPPFVDPVKDA